MQRNAKPKPSATPPPPPAKRPIPDPRPPFNQNLETTRRPCSYLTPIPKSKKRKQEQEQLDLFEEQPMVAFEGGEYDPTSIVVKTTLKAEIDEEAWASLNRDLSRPFPKPSTGRIAVKVINHLGDEVMKVFSVS